MSTKFKCTECFKEIDLPNAIELQIAEGVKSKLQAEQDEKQQEIDDLKATIQRNDQDLELQRQSIQFEIDKGVAEKKPAMLSEAKKIASAEIRVDLDENREALKAARKQIDDLRSQEIKLRKLQESLRDQAATADLNAKRAIDAERERIESKILDKVRSENEFALKDKEQEISGLRKEISNLQKKATQGSQQLQGEVLEKSLEEILEASFREDKFHRVPKGKPGADLIQYVYRGGKQCGMIVIEAKRTKEWKHKWLEKLREDQRQAGGDFAVLVSEALPPGVSTFELIDGVYVCAWQCVRPLTILLRGFITNLSRQKSAMKDISSKQDLAFDYLTNGECGRRLHGLLEPIMRMSQELERETVSIKNIWAKRKKTIELAQEHAMRLAGDLAGIVQSDFPEIQSLALDNVAIELEKSTTQLEMLGKSLQSAEEHLPSR